MEKENNSDNTQVSSKKFSELISLLDKYVYELLILEKEIESDKLEEATYKLWKAISDSVNNLIVLLDKNQLSWIEIGNTIRQHDFFKKLIEWSDYARHIFYKPYWYAGDMHLMKKICERNPIWKTMIEKTLDNFYYNFYAAEAVRQRVKSLFETLKNLPNWSKVLNLACWPALEVQWFLEISDKNIEFFLIDSDPNTIQYLKDQDLDERVKLIEGNAFKLNSKRLNNLCKKQKVDLAYSSWLFDYIPDKFAPRITKALFEQVKSGWRVIIGNFMTLSDTNPQTKRQKFLMDEVVDWKLIYREPKEIESFLEEIDSDKYDYCIKNEYFGTNPNIPIGSIGFIIIDKK